MFITRKRLEEIKSHERWETERHIDREREMGQIRERLYQLERKVEVLEGTATPVEHHINMG